MNKFLPIKIICIILAIAIAAFAGISTVGFAQNAKTVYDEGRFDDYIYDFFKKGKDVDLLSSSAYANEKSEEIVTLQELLNLGDGSKEGYEAYCEKCRNYVEQSIDALGIEKSGKCYNGNELLFAMANDAADFSLQRVEIHKSHSLSATVNEKEKTAYYDANHGFYIVDAKYVFLPDGSFLGRVYNFSTNDVEVHYETDADFGDGEYTYTTLSPDEADEAEAADENVKAIISDNTGARLPKAVKEKESTLPIVEICNAICDGELYDGWYAVTPEDEDYYSISTFSSFSQYRNEVENLRNSLNDLPFDYAVLSADGKELITTNVDSLKEKSAKDAEAVFTSEGKVTNTLYWSDDALMIAGRFDIESENPNNSNISYKVFIAYTGDSSDAAAYLEEYETFCQSFAQWLITIGVCALLLLLLLVLLIVFCGRKNSSDEAKIRFSDRVFVLIRTVFNSGLLALLAASTWNLAELFLEKKAVSAFVAKALAALICIAAAAVAFDLVLFFARNIKAHKLSDRFFVIWIVKKMIDARRKKAERLASMPPVFKNIRKDVIRRALIYAVPMIVLSPIFAACIADNSHSSSIIGLFILFVMAVWTVGWLIYTVGYAKDVGAILAGIRDVSEGESVTIDPRNMKAPLRSYAYALNKVSFGSKTAIEKAVREQNTKTELITNISHDLKTPLTSIINYVDLLSQTEIDDEKAREYIGILGEKSSKLKRLIEDLIEASKATTGNVEVHLMNMSFNELCRQISGEYDDEMRAQGLELVSEIPEDDIVISADMKMIYRVLDNLMNNARKYSLPGTRVYLTLSRDGLTSSFTLKNISAQGLNISAEELKQRFVRGDASRTENGSGLGLSIAESFCELMGAKLELEIDGDMFTARVRFNNVFESERTQTEE